MKSILYYLVISILHGSTGNSPLQQKKKFYPMSISGTFAIGDLKFSKKIPLQKSKEILNNYYNTCNDSSSEIFSLHCRSTFITNVGNSQYLRINGAQSDSYWSNYFTVGYFSKKSNEKFVSVNIKKFTINEVLELGTGEAKVLSLIGSSPDCILKSAELTVYKYYWFNKNSIDYEQYQIPYYVASFIFKSKKLIKAGFGMFKAERDGDFFPKKYKIVKGKVFQ